MSTELQRARNRQMFIFLLVCVGMLLLLSRLYYWQVMNVRVLYGKTLAQLANDEHIQSQILTAPRGLIYDAQGHILATNVVRDDVYIEPIQFWADHQHDENPQAELSTLIHMLHQVLPDVSENTLQQAFNFNLQTYRINGQPIDPAQSRQLQLLRLSDVFLQPRVLRSYPGGNLAAQVLGYVAVDGKGYYGIESQYNTLLAGKSGSFTAETDLNGHPLTVGASLVQPVVNGADLTLTVDSTVEYMVQTALADAVEKLQAQSGTVIVLNAHTGAVIAMAGAPNFDPNHYSDFANITGCLGQESIYLNPALYCAYEPGSTMKSVTMAAALDQGIITPSTTLYDPGYIKFSDAPAVTNWEYRSYGTETMTQVLEHSANVGAAHVAHDLLGAGRYYPYLTLFGFGQLSGVNDGPEQTGFYNTDTSAGWTPSDLTRQAFGQSIEVTPLQMAMAYQAIANGGVMMRPYLVASIHDNGRVVTIPPQVKQRVITQQTAQVLTNMLVSTASYNKQASFPGYSIAVKTGTATTVSLPANQTEASMAGFLPASNPQFVILVKIDRPQATIYGSTAAAPLWKAIAEQLVWHYNVLPDQ